MSADIVKFPMTPNSALPSREEQKQKIDESRLNLVRAVREKASDRETELELNDEIGPARVVGQLIAEAKKLKITQLRLHEMLREKNCQITHLERYRVRPGKSTEPY